MKKKVLNQLVAAALVCGSILAVGNVSANATIKTENGKTYNYNEAGQKQLGWFQVEAGKWSYFNKDGEMVKDTTIKIDGRDYKFDANGVSLTEYGTTFNYGKDLIEENGKIYYVNASGQKTNWFRDDGKMYYYNEKGEMQKDTTVKDEDGKEVKLNKNGVVVGEHGYEMILGKEVTYDSSEAYKNSNKKWKKEGNDWKCNAGLGNVISWYKDNGVWYYFNDQGIMQKNTTVKDDRGNDCILNADGALTNRSKPEIDMSKIHSSTNNEAKKNGWQEEGNKMYYYKDGVKQKNTTIIVGGAKYVVDADGAWIK